MTARHKRASQRTHKASRTRAWMPYCVRRRNGANWILFFLLFLLGNSKQHDSTGDSPAASGSATCPM